MKFLCKKENLKRGVNLVSHLAGKNQNLPILNNLLLEVGRGVMSLSSTNLEIGIKSVVRGRAEEDGSFTVPAKLFNDYINNLNSENIELTKEKGGLMIKAENTQTLIKGMEGDEFPLIPKIEEKTLLKVNKNDLNKGLSMVIFATAMDNTRPEISGVFFNMKEKEILMVATDSYRLAEKKLKYNLEKGELKKIIIPNFTLQELNRIINETDSEEVLIKLNDNQIVFEIDSTRLTSRLIEGNYPDYQQVIPQKTKTKTIIKRVDFIQAVRTASLFCRQGINDVAVVIENNKVEIKALNDQVGENQTVLEANVEGEKNSIVFNYHYILDGLNSINSEEVEFSLDNNSLPGKFVPKANSDYVYIIMPIKQ